MLVLVRQLYVVAFLLDEARIVRHGWLLLIGIDVIGVGLIHLSIVNDCIIGAEERVIAVQEAAGQGEITLFPVECCSHSAVLCQKPLLEYVPGL